MGCDSWIFVHKHIAKAEDGNGRVIERKVLWNYSSWEIGEMVTSAFDLPNGTYRSTCSEHLLDFADNCLYKLKTNKKKYKDPVLLKQAFNDIKKSLRNLDPRDDFFVSVDW